ncbi:DUF5666 domain-containing protein [Rhodoferax sp.]|uniref:DUF5666 domain-containing protein n=1 Tax=Rhodoferax sp. TaxID=50421 RepID=UPI00260AB77A|nr:DUF5666 domain-containing protein [Rhodoferax sp.]MDD2923946.1 DUF5666 domain-containing protein [Rhodoferax sp.]
MNPLDPSAKGLTRRAWMVLAGSTLSACGGGGGLLAALPGTGGTGSPLFAQGSISGFGSVIINGIKFDDTQAQVQVDGQTVTSADLRLGMVAEVQGERGADLTLGSASSIAVWSIAQGMVSQSGSSSFVVSGMTVQTGTSTVFEGVSSVGQLVARQRVAVWGLQTGTDGTHWSATRVAVQAADTQVVSSGMVRVADGVRLLNGYVLTGSQAVALSAGTLVRVQGVLAADGGSLEVNSVKALGVLPAGQMQGEVEIEAYVTAITSASRFTMGSFEVDASSAYYQPLNAKISVGARVEVYGSWTNGVLKATKVELEDEQTLDQAEIKGSITSFTSVADFVVRGQRCDASAATFSHGKAVDLKLGAYVKVSGTKAGDVLKVTSVEFHD